MLGSASIDRSVQGVGKHRSCVWWTVSMGILNCFFQNIQFRAQSASRNLVILTSSGAFSCFFTKWGDRNGRACALSTGVAVIQRTGVLVGVLGAGEHPGVPGDVKPLKISNTYRKRFFPSSDFRVQCHFQTCLFKHWSSNIYLWGSFFLLIFFLLAIHCCLFSVTWKCWCRFCCLLP